MKNQNLIFWAKEVISKNGKCKTCNNCPLAEITQTCNPKLAIEMAKNYLKEVI